MASGTRSSKRKSSPSSYSLKKKRRTKGRSKKRSKLDRGKSKKVYRRNIPDSYSDNESSASDSSVSYSSTDSDHRRSRSRTRKDAGRLRKKSRRSRMRSESSEDSVKVRKNRRSKRRRNTDAKKKLRGKRRREPSISSSSRSLSCSTCQSSDGSEREYERTEKRVKRSRRSRRDLDDHRSWSSHRSRSCSSCRLHSGDDSYQSEERALNENNSRRLRSVIIFAKECEEEDREQLDRDEHKEEIIYDQDDYPSPRSNDSNDGETRREICHSSHVVPGQTGFVEEDRCKEMVEHDVNGSTFREAGVKDSSSDADLEAVLRQRALENLRKFKGGVRANASNPASAKSSCDVEVKESLGLNAGSDLNKDLEGSVGVAGAPSAAHSAVAKYSSCTIREKSKASGSNISMSVSVLSDKPKDSGISFKKEHTRTDKFVRKARPLQESSSVNRPVAERLQSLPQDSTMVAPSEEGGGGGETSTLKKGHLGADKFQKQAFPTEETSVLNMPTSGMSCTVESVRSPLKDGKGLIDSVDGDINDEHEAGPSTTIHCLGSNEFQNEMTPIQEDKDTVESLQSSDDTKMATDDVDKTITGLSTSHSSNLQGQSSNVKENEDEDSQFQQKTMSVMRGGEMVQVSYKVYVPKRAPALARRKLRR